MNIRADSTEYLYGTVTADHDLNSSTIDVAMPQPGQAPATWYAAEVTEVTSSAAQWTATYRLLVGPNGGVLTLAPGHYDWTLRLSDTPERPVLKTGSVYVTLT